MAKIKNAKVKTSSGGYDRVFDNKELGCLCSAVQSTVISNGNELERLILARTNNITDLPDFINKTTVGVMPDGVYVCTKKTVKKAVHYTVPKIEPDLLVFIVEQTRICKVIELKDGDNFDTKKAKGEKENLERFSIVFGSRIPFVAEYYVCCFNQLNKQSIVEGFKHEFSIDHVMTGKELCDILKISYDEIISLRQADAKENLDYYIDRLLKIDCVKQKIEEKLSK